MIKLDGLLSCEDTSFASSIFLTVLVWWETSLQILRELSLKPKNYAAWFFVIYFSVTCTLLFIPYRSWLLVNFVLGDRILEINGHSLEGLSRQEVKYFENPQVDVEAYNSLFKYTSQGVDTGFF